MKESGIETLAKQLLDRIYSTVELKHVSTSLESLSQSNSFKSSAQIITSDSNLNYSIKKTQLLYLFKDLENEVLYNFFSDMFAEHEFWMFSSSQFDYFDEFVQTFQMLIEKLTVVNMVTAIEIHDKDLSFLAKTIGESLETKVVIHPQVNPAIIGGVQMRVGNLVFDYSLRSKFLQFQRHWISQIEKTSKSIDR